MNLISMFRWLKPSSLKDFLWIMTSGYQIYRRSVKMLKWIQMIVSLIATLPVKLMEVAADKVITVKEFIGVCKITIESLKYDGAVVAKIGPNEKKVIEKITKKITDSLQDRELTLKEVFEIVESTVEECGISNKKIFGLK